MIYPPIDSHVDIHLTNGTLVRGIITRLNDDVVFLGHKPAIHSVQGVQKFEYVTIDRNHVVAVGVRVETDSD
ncbi:MAG: hypothetical protein WC087_03935 [Candidatus Paceibacterota bacterium]